MSLCVYCVSETVEVLFFLLFGIAVHNKFVFD